VRWQPPRPQPKSPKRVASLNDSSTWLYTLSLPSIEHFARNAPVRL
jgi:hypothetical protein